MRKSKIFIAFLFTLFVSAFAFAEPIKVGSLAPDFSIELSTGQTVKLSDYKGKAVFLHFWATWCPPCRVELPEMEKLFQKTKAESNSLEFIAVCVSDTEQKRKSFMQKDGYTFEGGLDKDNSIGNKYQITGIPTSILIDADGKIQKINVGMMTPQKLKDFVKDYISF